MYYKPHILERRVTSPIGNDEYGRPLKRTSETYEHICSCRCDDNTKTEIRSNNGQAYIPSYHIVCEGNIGKRVIEGDYIRILDLQGGIRAEGTVAKTKNLNLLRYSEIWV